MRRTLLNVITALSLALCVASAALWLRSHRRCDKLNWYSATNDFGMAAVSLMSGEGSAMFVYQPFAAKGRLAFQYQSTPTYLYPGSDWKGTSLWNRLGFFGRWGIDRVLIVPFWSVLLVGTVAPTIRLGSYCRRLQRQKLGRCLRCGYDLRATPDRCPECGLVPATAA